MVTGSAEALGHDQVVGMVIISKFGEAITNFGIANLPLPVSTFSHATDYLTKLLTPSCPGCGVLPNRLSMAQRHVVVQPLTLANRKTRL
jgi:hypothetical protein